MLTLKIEKRDKKERPKELRTKGLLPAVFYGRKEQSTPISAKLNEFEKIFKKVGESSVFVISGVGDDKEVLIQAVDFDPVTEIPRHADFYVIEKGKKITVSVPIKFVGISPAVKDLGGILVKVLYELEIETFPKDLPHEIEVDISPITKFEEHIQAKDIKLPQGVVLKTDPEEIVALVSEAKDEKEEETVDISDIEVEQKGKKETDGPKDNGKSETEDSSERE